MVMHARKSQRINDGYFEKHQAHPYQSSKYNNSKRDYDREANIRSTNYMRDRDNQSPGNGQPGGNGSSSGPMSLNNGTSALYHRSVNSPNDMDSPRDGRGGGGGGGGGDRDRDRDCGRYINVSTSSYMQRMKDRDRDYKRDKYSDKRDRRDRGDGSDHRTNHDRIESSSRRTMKSHSSGDKRSGSDDRDRDRDRDNRDRDRDRERDRERDRTGDRGAGAGGSDLCGDRSSGVRIGEWSEHVSSSGKKYYYNSKTEISQWEKPKEWLERERFSSKDQHRDYREKEQRDHRERDDRMMRCSYGKHSREDTRYRWNEQDRPAQRRRKDGEGQDMDISPGDSTPTSEASYSHSITSTVQHPQQTHQSAQQQQTDGNGPTIMLANVLPRLPSHPSTPTNSQLHFTTPHVGVSSTSAMPSAYHTSGGGTSVYDTHSPLVVSAASAGMKNYKLDGNQSSPPLTINLLNQTGQSIQMHTGNSTNDLNSNAPGPPIHTPVTMANLPKILSQITGNKQMDSGDLNPQKALQTINNALLSARQQQQHQQQQQQQQQQHQLQTGGSGTVNDVQLGNNSNSLRDILNSPLYLQSHMQYMPINHSSKDYATSPHITTVTSGMLATTQTTGYAGLSSQFSAVGMKSDGSQSHMGAQMLCGDGPPTPTQEMELVCGGGGMEHRKLDGTSSSSLSSLQGVVTSTQTLRCQGPSLTPSLANYFRVDLIAHVTNWPAEQIEKQAQKHSDEAHIVGDLQCTKVSSELKCARSLVRITEITATLQEQKIMYLRQQIRRLEELKSQNSFMSEDL